MSNKSTHPRPQRRALLELRADGDADDALDFTAAVFRALARVCEERGWRIDVHALDEVADLAGVRRATVAIDGSITDLAAG